MILKYESDIMDDKVMRNLAESFIMSVRDGSRTRLWLFLHPINQLSVLFAR